MQKHFELVIVLILLVSLLPTIIGLLKAKFGKKPGTAANSSSVAAGTRNK